MKYTKIVLLALFSLILTACSNNDDDDDKGKGGSSNVFAPASADAFETKFMNQTISSNPGVNYIIKANKTLQRTKDDDDDIVPYVYSLTGANMASITFVLGSENCITTFTFKTSLTGDMKEERKVNANSTTSLSGNFVISGSN